MLCANRRHKESSCLLHMLEGTGNEANGRAAYRRNCGRAVNRARDDARRKRLELVPRYLADLEKNATNLGDEPMATLVHRAWQRAASLLLKVPTASQPSGFDPPTLM